MPLSVWVNTDYRPSAKYSLKILVNLTLNVLIKKEVIKKSVNAFPKQKRKHARLS